MAPGNYDNDNISEAMNAASRRHNEVVGDVIRKIGANVNNELELAVLMESLLLGSMLLSLRLFNTQPETVQHYYGLAINRALSRFDKWQQSIR